ncbi:MAG: hypothetical protein OEQ53_01280 [Saprospiraceae bacterium]|nr:hypothetical protein [Saprospiraceae bacterium]
MMSDEDAVLGIGSRVNHPAYGDGVVIRIHKAAYEVCFVKFGIKDVGRSYSQWEIIESIPAQEIVSFNEAEEALVKILEAFSDISRVVELGDKWDGGMMTLQPKDTSLKAKEIPIDTFFHKIVMVRDRLRVMEQRINSSKITDEEKINLQQYITRIYGSLTTFNVLFRHKEDYFVGDKT